MCDLDCIKSKALARESQAYALPGKPAQWQQGFQKGFHEGFDAGADALHKELEKLKAKIVELESRESAIPEGYCLAPVHPAKPDSLLSAHWQRSLEGYTFIMRHAANAIGPDFTSANSEKALAEMLQGKLISVDISTGEHDSEARVYGRVIECMTVAGGSAEFTILAEVEQA